MSPIHHELLKLEMMLLLYIHKLYNIQLAFALATKHQTCMYVCVVLGVIQLDTFIN